jgi:hypothetical protein
MPDAESASPPSTRLEGREAWADQKMRLFNRAELGEVGEFLLTVSFVAGPILTGVAIVCLLLELCYG